MRKRWIAGCLLGGIVLNVVVAWTCAAYSPNLTIFQNPAAIYHGPPLAGLEDGRIPKDGCHIDWRRDSSIGYDHYQTDSYHSERGQPAGDVNFYPPSSYPHVREMGWPMRSMRSITHVESGTWPWNKRRWQLPWSEILGRGVQTADLPAGMRANPDARLAIVPIPLGFVVNSIFYAVMTAIAARGLAELRRRYGRKPGFDVIVPPPA